MAPLADRSRAVDAFPPPALRRALFRGVLLELRGSETSSCGCIVEWFSPTDVLVASMDGRHEPALALAPFADSSFDGVMMFGALGGRRVADADTLDAVARVLAPGGHLVLSDFVCGSGERQRTRLGADAPALAHVARALERFAFESVERQLGVTDMGRMIVAQRSSSRPSRGRS